MTDTPRAVHEDLDELRMVYLHDDTHPTLGEIIHYDLTDWRVHTLTWGTGFRTMLATASPI